MYQQGYHDLSEQYVLQCTYENKDPCISGGVTTKAIDLIKQKGIPKDVEPYKYRAQINYHPKSMIC